MSNDPQSPTEIRTLACPRCKAKMEPITFQDITVDRCTACKGLWFDAMEKEHLDALRGSETIDVGAGPAAAASARMDCPVCRTRMIDMVDLNDPTLHFQSCQICFGLFFDAGEYREHKDHVPLSFFHRLFHRR